MEASPALHRGTVWQLLLLWLQCVCATASWQRQPKSTVSSKGIFSELLPLAAAACDGTAAAIQVG